MRGERLPLFKMLASVLLGFGGLFALLAAGLGLWAAGSSLGRILLFGAGAVGAVGLVIALIWRPNLLKKPYYILLVVFMGLLCGYGLRQPGPKSGAPALPVLDGSLDPADYRPFDVAAPLARLETRSTLELTQGDALPRVGCVTALCPVAAAFVEAVYPMGDYGPGGKGGVGPGSLPFAGEAHRLIAATAAEAYRLLLAGEVDLILAPAPTEAQMQDAATVGRELLLTPVGMEALVFYTFPEGPVENLSLKQARGLVDGVETSGSIGQAFGFFARDAAARGEIRLLAVDGIPPDPGSIRSGLYPFTARFYAVTAGSQNPHVAAFVDWMTSPQGQFLVAGSGYVPLGDTT